MFQNAATPGTATRRDGQRPVTLEKWLYRAALLCAVPVEVDTAVQQYHLKAGSGGRTYPYVRKYKYRFKVKYDMKTVLTFQDGVVCTGS